MHFCVAGALALLVSSAPAEAQIFKSDRSFWFYFENDAFGGNSDSSYTNGIRLGWEFAYGNKKLGRLARWLSLEGLVDAVSKGSIPTATRECVPQGDRASTRPCLTIGFGLTQTMYTPSNIIDTTLQADDRPFAGLFYASAIVGTTRNHWQHSTEFMVGVIGPMSGAEATQSLAHWTWSAGSEKPRGWHHQLRNQVQLGLVNNWNQRLWEICRPPGDLGGPKCDGTGSEERKFDVTARYEAALTTHITRGSAGVVVRVGNRFPDALTLNRISTTGGSRTQTKRPSFWYNAFFAADTRYVVHNALITGTSKDNVPGRFGYERTITFNRNVTETAGGGTIGFGDAMISYQLIKRRPEYTPGGGPHVFGALTFSLFTPTSR